MLSVYNTQLISTGRAKCIDCPTNPTVTCPLRYRALANAASFGRRHFDKHELVSANFSRPHT